MQHISHSYSPGRFFLLSLHAPCIKGANLAARVRQMEQAHNTALLAHSARCHAVAVMPNRIDAVWALPDVDMTHSARLRAIEKAFGDFLNAHSPDHAEGLGRWRLRIRAIKRPTDVARHVDGCHFAPVRHGWAHRPEDWVHSTIHIMAPSAMILT
jgi:putative transposase